MADYNIYLHADSVLYSNPTMPWSSGGTPQLTPWESNTGADAANEVKQVAGMTTNAITTFGSSKGFGGVAGFLKSNPYVAAAAAVIAVAVAVYKVGTNIASTINDVRADVLGDYDSQMELKNFTNSVHALFNPAETIINRYKFQWQLNRENQRRALSRQLLGDSVINAYANRGV